MNHFFTTERPDYVILAAYLEEINEAYALAKIAGLKMCQYYNKQYGTKFISVMPTNLYGSGITLIWKNPMLCRP